MKVTGDGPLTRALIAAGGFTEERDGFEPVAPERVTGKPLLLHRIGELALQAGALGLDDAQRLLIRAQASAAHGLSHIGRDELVPSTRHRRDR